MRLSTQQKNTIVQTGKTLFGNTCQIWLFGSRTDDQARGGDIDLFVETDHPLENRVADAARFAAQLQMALGDQKIDIIINPPATPEQTIHQIAHEGILLTRKCSMKHASADFTTYTPITPHVVDCRQSRSRDLAT